MASKMLVDRSNSTETENRDVYYCIPCAIRTGAVENEELEHDTDISDCVCSVCQNPIASLPEPPIHPFEVALRVTLIVYLKASSPIEAQQLAFDALDIKGEGIKSWECAAQESYILGDEVEQ